MKNKTNNSKITTEVLAVMVKNGFDSVDKRFDKMASKEEMYEGFNAVNKKLDRIENLLVRAHENRIETLEDNMRLVKTKLAIR